MVGITRIALTTAAAFVIGLSATPKLQAAPEKTIVATAVSNPDFSTLVTAVKAAGLVDTLSDKGPFTVFAPTNKAFATLEKKIGTKKFDYILAHKKLLTAILTYHVLAGKVVAANVMALKNGAKVKTVEGSFLIVHHGMKGVFVNRAKVITTNIMCSNGVIHVINQVLLPPDLKKYMH